MQIGIYSFGDATPDPATARRPDEGQRIRELVEEIVLADEVGLDIFGVGEHHRPDFPVSSPARNMSLPSPPEMMSLPGPPERRSLPP